LVSLLALCTSTAFGGVGLTRSGGVLGSTMQYDLVGDPGELFAFLPSTNTGPTPLSIIDPLDTRVLGVGIDMLSLLTIGSLGPLGQTTLSFPLPADPGLSGVPIHAQLMTIPGTLTLIDEISPVNSFVLGLHGESFLSLGSLPVATAGYGSALLPDGRVLLGGGGVDDGLGNNIPQNTLRVFDPQTQGFSDLAATLTYAAMTPAAVALADGRIFFCGGVGANDVVLSGASIFDPVTGTTSAAASMPGPRSQHTATLLNDGRVFITGGVKAVNSADPIAGLNDVLKTSKLYDPATNSWASAASLPLPRVGHNATLLGTGKVLISGGLEVASLFGIPLPSLVNTCKRYNPSNNSMMSTASFSGDRALHSQLTLSDGRVLVAGGADGDVLTQNFFSLNTCRVYRESTNSWTNVMSLPEVRTFPSLVEIAGMVHVISGVGTIDLTTLTGTPVTNIVSGDLATFNWTSVGTMAFPRALSRSIAIEGGDRVVTLGPGDNGLGTDDLTAEVYIP
jgi:N-acetylneuraminic acid mutarotase